jgi:hypothetical protein
MKERTISHVVALQWVSLHHDSRRVKNASAFSGSNRFGPITSARELRCSADMR